MKVLFNRQIFLFFLFFTIHSYAEDTSIPKPKILSQYQDSSFGIEFLLPKKVALTLKYNLGFEGAGDMNSGFPELLPQLVLDIPNLPQLRFNDAKPIISKLQSLGLAEAAALVQKFAPLQGKHVFILKALSLLSNIALNQHNASLTFPQPTDFVLELNKLLTRFLKTEGAGDIRSLLVDMPGIVKDFIERIKIPNKLDRDTIADDKIALITFLEKRIKDMNFMVTRPFENDLQYSADLKNSDEDPTIRLNSYQIFKRLFSIVYRAQNDANEAIAYLFKNAKKVGEEVGTTFGETHRDEMRNVIKLFTEKKKAYENSKAASSVQEYQRAKLKLMGFVIRFVKYPRVSNAPEESIKDFCVRELRKLIPQAPGFEKVAQLIDPVLAQTGLSISMLIGNEKMPEAPPPALDKDPLADMAIDTAEEF